MGVVQSLGQITDHPKISVDPKEHDRIALDKRYFEGKFRKIEFRNTYGDLKKRPYVTLNMMQVICRRLASLLYNEQSKITIETRPRKLTSPEIRSIIKLRMKQIRLFMKFWKTMTSIRTLSAILNRAWHLVALQFGLMLTTARRKSSWHGCRLLVSTHFGLIRMTLAMQLLQREL